MAIKRLIRKLGKQDIYPILRFLTLARRNEAERALLERIGRSRMRPQVRSWGRSGTFSCRTTRTARNKESKKRSETSVKTCPKHRTAPPLFQRPNHMLAFESATMNARSSLVSCVCGGCSSAAMTQVTLTSAARKCESCGAVSMDDGRWTKDDGWMGGGDKMKTKLP
jgi:hypothetical protein